ncbi:hypothetical protein ACHAXN_002173 [Cyclotella atomus]
MQGLCLDFGDGFICIQGKQAGYIFVFKLCSLERVWELGDVKIVWESSFVSKVSFDLQVNEGLIAGRT